MRPILIAVFLFGCSSGDDGNTFGSDAGKDAESGVDPYSDASFNSDSGSSFMPGPNCAMAGMHTFCDDFDGDLSKWMVAGDATQDTAIFSSSPKSLRAGPGGTVAKTFGMTAAKITVAFDLYVDQAAMNDVVLPAVIEAGSKEIGVGAVFWSSNLADISLQILDTSWTSGSIAKVALKQWVNIVLTVDWAAKAASVTVNGMPGQLKFAFGAQSSFNLRAGSVGFKMPPPATTVHIDNLRLDAQ